MGEHIQISCVLVIPSFCIGYLADLLSVKNLPDWLYLFGGMGFCFLQIFLTIGSFKWFKKTFSCEEKGEISIKTVVVSIFVAYVFWYIGWCCGPRGVPV